MKLSQLIITTSLISLLPVGAALAYGGHGKGIEQRLERQEMRIAQGQRSGALTRHEARRLTREHDRVSQLYQAFQEDGHLSKKERRKLHRKLDRVSDNIRDFKHNDHYRHGSRQHGQYQDHTGGRAGGHQGGYRSGYQGGDRIVFSDKGVKLVLRFDGR